MPHGQPVAAGTGPMATAQPPHTRTPQRGREGAPARTLHGAQPVPSRWEGEGVIEATQHAPQPGF